MSQSTQYFKNYQHGSLTNLTLKGNIVNINIGYKDGKKFPFGFVTVVTKSKTQNGEVKDFLNVRLTGWDAKRVLEKTNPGDGLDIVGTLRSGLNQQNQTYMFVEPSMLQINLNTKKSIEAAKTRSQSQAQPQYPQQPMEPAAQHQAQPQYQQQAQPQYNEPPQDFDDDIPF